jgi:formamidopyrimidine-DNA glycosylase
VPEMPEVETIRRGLMDTVLNKRVAETKVLKASSFRTEADPRMACSVITDIKRYGKMLVIELENGFSLVIHLMMTGQLIIRENEVTLFSGGHPTRSLISALPDKSTKVIFAFNNSKLFFNDERGFGYVKLLETKNVAELDFIKKLGPEPPNDIDVFLQRIRKHKIMIKPVLLNQSIIAGLGNIYVDETLFLSKVHPKSLTSNLDHTLLTNIYLNADKVMQLSIKHGGSTWRNYLNVQQEMGDFLNVANVYQRHDSPCKNCGAKIQKIRIANRGTHFCQNCQVLY